MKYIFLVLFGVVSLSDLESIKSYATTASRLEEITCQMASLSDKGPEDEYKSPERFIKDGGGDCDDYAEFVYRLLGARGYEVKIYVLEGKKSNHAICWYKRGKEEGYFTNGTRWGQRNFDIEKFTKREGYETWLVKI